MELQARRVDKINCGKCGQPLDTGSVKPLTRIKCPGCGYSMILPARFGDFLLVSGLGRGSMGIVCKALDEKLLRQVAIKILKTGDDDRQLIESCLREARALATMNHPNVVQVYSIGDFHGQQYIVMELLDGGTVEQSMVGQLNPERDTLDIALAIADGLRAAHRAGLVHLDVKPGNILFDRSRIPKLVDFGVSQFARSDPEKLVGTPLYVAPEIVRGKSPDFRSDIYSLGASLFHLLAGQPPFPGKSSAKVMTARLKQPAPWILDLRGDLREETAQVVAGMLEMNPDDRYSSYDHLLEALQIARNASQQPAPVDPLSQLAEATNQTRLRKRS